MCPAYARSAHAAPQAEETQRTPHESSSEKCRVGKGASVGIGSANGCVCGAQALVRGVHVCVCVEIVMIAACPHTKGVKQCGRHELVVVRNGGTYSRPHCGSVTNKS